MKCPKCNKDINDNAKYCNKCGYKIEDKHIDQYLYSELYSKTYKQRVTSEEDYIRNYIGSNYETIKKENFSIVAFIFGPLYLLFKKVYTLSILQLLITILIYSINKDAATIFYVVISFYVGYKGNSIYLQNATRKVDEIKISNPDKSSTEILEICKNEGRINSSLIVFFITIIITNIIISLFINNKTSINEIIEENNIQTNTYKVQDLSFKLDSIMNNEALTNKYLKSTLKDDNNNCSITVISDKYTHMYNSIEDYINKNVYINKSDEMKINTYEKVNNILFKKINTESNVHDRYMYFTIYNDNIYYIEYTQTKTHKNTYCNKEYDTLLSSIIFNKEQ